MQLKKWKLFSNPLQKAERHAIRLAMCCALLPLLAACNGGTVVTTDGQSGAVSGTPEDSTLLVNSSVGSNEEASTQQSLPESPGEDASAEGVDQEQSFTATAADVTDLILVTGQSNALGAGTGYDAFLDAPDNRVMAYTNEGWQVADLNQVWDQNWFPRNDPNTPPSNNFSLHFGKRVATRAPDRVVGFILLSSPGSPISEWERDGALFNSIRDKVSRAISELPNKSRVDGILWHQGESDGEDKDQYSAALYDLISRFRSELWFAANLPFICGETASSPVNNQLNRLNSDADFWTACVKGDDLSVIPGGSMHFDAAGLRTLGQRYGDAFLSMYLGIE